MQPSSGDDPKQPDSESHQDLSDDVIEILDSPDKKSVPSRGTFKARRSPSPPETHLAPVFSQMTASTAAQGSANLKRKRSSVDELINRDSIRAEKHKEPKWKSCGQASEPSRVRSDPMKAVRP